MTLVLIAPPASEPVSVDQLMLQMGFGAVNDDGLSRTLNAQLSTHIASARSSVEGYLRRALITQRWQYRMGGFSDHHMMLPMPPLQSIDFFKYVDTTGTVQTILRDTTYGNNTSAAYGYQLEHGSDTQPGFVAPSWATPWPPTRMVPSSVIIQMRVGYGQPITATMAQGSAVLTANVKFNPDDAPQLAGETGLPISIPKAGPGGSTLNTFVASVDSNGKATLADVASVADVSDFNAWAGVQIPADITTSILLLAQFYYEQASVGQGDIPEWIMCKLKPYRNLIS